MTARFRRVAVFVGAAALATGAGVGVAAQGDSTPSDRTSQTQQMGPGGGPPAGGMMTPEPVILPPDATVAEALARIRDSELTPALACMVYVCRSPLETPTGRFIGAVHFQRLLREPPSTLVSALIDSELENLTDDSTLHEVSRYFATYNLVNAPVVDDDHRLIGAITVDDVLDHVLPEDWRGTQLDSLSDHEVRALAGESSDG